MNKQQKKFLRAKQTSCLDFESKEQLRKLIKENQYPYDFWGQGYKQLRYEWLFDEKFLRELFTSGCFFRPNLFKRLPKSVINGKKYKKLIEENCLNQCVEYVSKDLKKILNLVSNF